MPLIPNVLNVALEEAFDKAMLVFAETIAKSPSGVDVSNNARKAAAKTFASIATPAIDLYIKSQTIIIPPGQALTAPPPAGVGATVAPSPPAIIT
jgi:hypothetical protein